MIGLSNYLHRANVQHIAVAGVSHPEVDSDTFAYYMKKLRGVWYHGSNDKIESFKGPLFLAGSSVAKSYGYDGYLYKCKVNSTKPLILDENCVRMQRTGNNSPTGMLLQGTDTELRDFVRKHLLQGARQVVIDSFNDLYKRNGVRVPARLFCSESYSGWAVVADNLTRMGYDSMVFEDESFDRQLTGTALFVPDSSSVEILDVSPISDYGEIREDFDAE